MQRCAFGVLKKKIFRPNLREILPFWGPVFMGGDFYPTKLFYLAPPLRLVKPLVFWKTERCLEEQTYSFAC